MTFKRDLLPDPVSYFESRGQQVVGKRGKHFRTTCTIHGGDGHTLSVLRGDGGFNCFACGAKGGDIVAYAMQADGVDFVTACKSLGAWVDDSNPAARFKPTALSPRQALQLIALESMVVALVAADMARGIVPGEETKDRMLEAAGLINVIREQFQ